MLNVKVRIKLDGELVAGVRKVDGKLCKGVSETEKKYHHKVSMREARRGSSSNQIQGQPERGE